MAERRYGGRRGDARGNGRGGGRGDLPNEEVARQRDLRDIENDDLRQQVRDLQRDIENGDLRQQVRDLQRRLARLENRRGKSNPMRSNASERRSVDDPLFNDVYVGQSKPVYDKDILSMPVYDTPVYDEDILLMPVYDKPVYDEDIFYELPGLISGSPPPSVIIDDTAEVEDVVVDDDEEYGKAERGNHLQGEYQKICDEYSDFTTCWNVLHNVVEFGNFEICKFLIKSVKVYIDEGDTPLAEAVKWEHIKIAEFLLNQGAKFNPPNVEGFTPLHYAVIEDNMELKELFFEAGADQNLFFSGIIPLGVYAKGDEVDSRSSLFQEGEYDAVIEDKSWRLRKVYIWFYLFPS